MLESGRLPLGQFFPNMIEVSRQMEEARAWGEEAGLRPPTPQLPRGEAPAGSWPEAWIATERAKHPEWERARGEPPEDYANRMLGVMRTIAPGAAKLIGSESE